MNIKSYLTFLSRNKAYTAINVFGLSVSLMFVMLIGVYVWQEYSVDKQHAKRDRIYALGIDVKGDRGIGSSRQLKPYLGSHYPEIESMCAVVKDDKVVMLPMENWSMKSFLNVDSTFFRMFDFPLLQGDRRHVLDAVDNCVVSESLAHTLFADNDPIGKQVKLGNGKTLKITGVMADMVRTSFVKADVVCRFEHVSNPSLVNGLNNATGTCLFIQTKSGTDFMAKENDLNNYFKEFFWIFQLKDIEVKAFLLPLTDLYFADLPGSLRDTVEFGNPRLVRLLFASCLVVLVFALLNYINLTVAQAGRRSREMAMRRLVGSRRSGIILRLISESVTLCLIALLLSVLLSYAFAGWVGQLLGVQLQLDAAIAPVSVGFILLGTLLLGVVAGVLPSILLSRARPIDVVRGTFHLRSKMVFSRVFIVLQNVVTIVMLVSAITMVRQARHLVHAPLGFNKDNIIINFNPGDSTQSAAFINELKRLSCVKTICASCGTPVDGGNNNTITLSDNLTASFQILKGDSTLLSVYNLKIKKPCTGGDSKKVYVNEYALNLLGKDLHNENWANIERSFGSSVSGAGVISDFLIRNIDCEMHPMVVVVYNGTVAYPWSHSILVTGDPVEAMNRVKEVYKQVYHLDNGGEMKFADQTIALYYEKETRLSHVTSLFAGITILISLLGLVAMSTYFIQQRQREIAIRKVFGSTSKQVCGKLIRTFLGYVAVAFVIAVPIAWYGMNEWLMQYSYRIVLSPWIFVIAGLTCFVICLLAVAVQSYVAANENPILHIKDNN